jgi:hypothetical protein
VPFSQKYYESVIDSLCAIQGECVSSDYAKFNDVSLFNTCNFLKNLTTDIISTVNESDVCFTNNECVCIEDCNHSMDVQLCNLNLITASTNLPVDNIVYSGIVSLNNAISYVGDVFTTACYLDKCNVFYDDCMFTTPLPGIATGSYIVSLFRLAWRWFPTNSKWAIM